MIGLWWQTGVIYEVYVRSFQDTNCDGSRPEFSAITRPQPLMPLACVAENSTIYRGVRGTIL
jgi:hypothetical protein